MIAGAGSFSVRHDCERQESGGNYESAFHGSLHPAKPNCDAQTKPVVRQARQLESPLPQNFNFGRYPWPVGFAPEGALEDGDN
jgi:hypothetical protein